MDLTYITNRDKSFINRYKLNRRAQQISEAIAKFKSDRELSLLDIGSADGYLLSLLNDKLRLKRSVGIELSWDCIRLKSSNDITLISAGAEALPFRNFSFDVIVAASLIDHLKNVSIFLKESHRALRKDGILVITAIIPFYDRLANIFGIDKGLHPHIKTFSISEIKEVLRLHNFKIVLAKRFALPSFGLIPFERHIESIFERLYLNQLMFYSIVIGQKE